MDCDAGSSRGEGFRRGDSAPGLPRGVGFGSRAGGSGSLRSPFVDVDSPSLPMVTARSPTARRRASGSAARGGERLSGGGAAPQRLGGARAVRSGWAGGAYRVARRLWFQASLFSHGVGPFLPCVPGLSALKGYKCHDLFTALR